jgi:hypothetical protein
MLSLFRRIVCYVIAMQMALTPLYGASAALPVVMVSDTVAQGLLKGQVIALANLNIKLLELNNAQTATNKKLDQILAAIKYIPDPKIKGPFPTTDSVLIEFSSSLYAAYTSDSIAYTPMREAAGAQKAAAAVAKVNASAAPAATPATSGTPDPAGTPAPAQGTATPYDPFDDSTPPLVSSTVPAGDFSGAFGPSAPINSTLGYTLKDSLIAKPSDPLGDIANFTDMAVKLAGDSARTFYNFQSLQNCGNAISCASSGLNVTTGILGTLKNYGINIGDANFQKNLGYVGAAVSFANLVTDLFSGGFNVQKLLQFINGMQQNILFSAISKGGLLTNDTNESKTLRIMSNFTTLFGYAGLFALRDTNAVGWIVALNNFSQIGAATKDTPQTGPLSKDTPLAGTTNLPPNQTLNTADTAGFLGAMLDCNKQKVQTTAACERDKGKIQRLLLGTLKGRCAAMAMSKQQVPAKMFQELFTGTGNKERCKKTAMYETKNGEQLCPSIALLQASSLAEGSVMSQMNVLIGLSMYNLVMTNVNTEQVILQNACASLGDLIEKGAPTSSTRD